MTIIKINAITVPAESGDELARRFAARAGAVDDQDGFEGFELLQPTDDRTTWLVVTRWRDEASFQAWVSSPAFGHGHQGPPAAESGESDPAPASGRGPGHDLRAVVVRDRAPGAAQVVCAAAMATRRGGIDMKRMLPVDELARDERFEHMSIEEVVFDPRNASPSAQQQHARRRPTRTPATTPAG